MMFLDDKDKVRDMETLPKKEFLESYSYITEKEYDENFKEHISNLARKIAEENDELDPNSIAYILQNNKDGKDIFVSMADYNQDNCYMINIFYPEKTYTSPEWAFSFMEDLYEYLTNNYELRWADIGCHCAIWEDISKGYDEDEVKEDAGIQLYMKYCQENGITSELINNTYETSNIMELYVGIPEKELTTIDFLKEQREMTLHNISVYSDGNFISKPKAGYEKEYNEEQQKLRIIDNLIENEKKKIDKNKEYER